MTKEEILRFLFWTNLRKFMSNTIQESKKFPIGWVSRKGSYYMDSGNPVDDPRLDDDNEFTRVFCEELDKLGIQFSIKSGEYGFGTKKKQK